MAKSIGWYTDNLAGNYEGGLIFDLESIIDSADIRLTLNSPVGEPKLRQSGRKLPSFCEALRMKLSLITSWAFPSELKLPGMNGLNYDLHVPLEESAPIDVCIVFWAKLACIYLCLKMTEQDFRQASDSIIG